MLRSRTNAPFRVRSADEPCLTTTSRVVSATGPVLHNSSCSRRADYRAPTVLPDELRLLDASPISTRLLRTGFDAIWLGRFDIRHARPGKRMLFSSGAVADALESAITVRRA